MDFRIRERASPLFYERQSRDNARFDVAVGIVDSTVVRDFSERKRRLSVRSYERASPASRRSFAFIPSISVRLRPRLLSRSFDSTAAVFFARALATIDLSLRLFLPRPRRAFFFSPPLLLRLASAPSLSGSHYLLITSYLVTCYPFARRSILLRANRVHASMLTRTF